MPIIAQVHGYCLAGGTELASARSMASPDMAWHVWMMGMRQAMEAMLTGDSMTGVEAVERGFANRAFAAADMDDSVPAVAERVAKNLADLQTLNKRVVHRAMEAMGMRDGMRATADINALGFHQRSSVAYHERCAEGVTAALDARDGDFGDDRTEHRGPYRSAIRAD